MKIFTLVGTLLLASASLVTAQVSEPVPSPQQRQMQMLKHQDTTQRHQFRKPKDPSNSDFKCKYDSKRDEYKCKKRTGPVNK